MKTYKISLPNDVSVISVVVACRDRATKMRDMVQTVSGDAFLPGAAASYAAEAELLESIANELSAQWADQTSMCSFPSLTSVMR